MDGLVLHDLTRRQLEHFMARPSHALLLTGADGIGKTAVAESIAVTLLAAPLSSYPYHLVIKPEGLSISIESIRGLQKFLTLKTTGDRPIRRTVIIEHANTMTIEAQNTFLKLLEEPPADTLIVLTAHSPRTLLPTILSRTQHIAIQIPTEPQIRELINTSKKDAETRQQAYFLSGGLPGLLQALLAEDQQHPMLESVRLAKEVLQKQPFERLAMVDTMSKQKEAALGLVEALERIAQAGLSGAGAKQDTARIKQWHRLRKAALQAKSALSRSANAKLALDDLFLNL